MRALRLGLTTIATAVLGPSLSACWVMLGDPFGALSRKEDPSDASTDTGPAFDVSNEYPPIDACRPAFRVANQVTYPTQSPRPELVIDGTRSLDTDNDPLCGRDARLCVVVAGTIRVRGGARLLVGGSRPLVLVAVGDLVIENGGVVNVAGADGAGAAGPGATSVAGAPGGGGGNAEPGAGNACGSQGGAPLDALNSESLHAGAHGGTAACVGGRGGGALQLVSLCGELIMDGTLDANGGAGLGGKEGCVDGSGGGAGGTVWLQGALVRFAASGAQVKVGGGGGGGGACRVGAGAWTAGNAGGAGGDPAAAGEGATCGGVTGGRGGGGGYTAAGPERGRSGTPAGGEVGCGGGGGARGRVFLAGPVTPSCAAVLQSGLCAVRY